MKKIHVGQCPECKELIYAEVSKLDFTDRFGPRHVIPVRAQCTQKHKYQLRYISRIQFNGLTGEKL